MYKKIFSKYHTHKEILNNFFWRSLLILGKQGITFFIFIMCAFLLSPIDFGIYNYILSFVFLLIVFVDFGLSSAITKFISEYYVLDKTKINCVLSTSIIFIFFLSVFVIIFTIFFGTFFLKENSNYLIYIFPLIFLIPFTSIYDGFYRGLKKFKELAIIFLVPGLIILPITYFLLNQIGLIGGLISQTFFYIILFLLLLKNNKLKVEFDLKILKSILKYSLILGLSLLGYYFYTEADILFLGYFNYLDEIAAYKLYTTTISILTLGFSIFGQIIFPNITMLNAKNEKEKIFKKFIKYSLLSGFAAIPIFIGMFFLYPLIVETMLPHLFTLEFRSMFNLLIWTLPLILINAVTSHFIVSTGNIHLSLLTIPFGILNIILNLFFINFFGYMGVIYSTLIVIFLSKTIVWMLLFKNLKYS